MLKTIQKYLSSLIQEPDFKNHSGIFKEKPFLLEEFIALAEKTPPALWVKQSDIEIDNWTTAVWYDTKIEEASLLNFNQNYRDYQRSFQLRIEEKTERDQPTSLFRHPDKIYHSLFLLEQDLEIGSAQGKRIQNMYQSLERQGIKDLSLAPQKGDAVAPKSTLSAF